VVRHQRLQRRDYRLSLRSRPWPGVYEVVRGQRSISADVALRLGKYFAVTPQFWMNLQADYDLRVAAASAPLDRIKPRVAA